jgi:hypothetical protein
MEVGDAVARLPRGSRGQGGGREEQAGQRMSGTDAGGGPGSAVLRRTGRLYEVRHQLPRRWQALHTQAVPVPAGTGAAPNRPPHTAHCSVVPAVTGAGAVEAGGQVDGSQSHRPHRKQGSSGS